MTYPSIVPKEVEDIRPYYTYDEYILSFQIEVGVSSLKDEEMVILEVCSPSERVTMHVTSDPTSTIFNSTSPLSRI